MTVTVLPDDLVRYIYEFDPTFYEMHRKVVHQLRMRVVWWLHFYCEKPWLNRVITKLNLEPTSRWIFHGEEFFWTMYTEKEYETLVHNRCWAHNLSCRLRE
jgi:hypothetical protein